MSTFDADKRITFHGRLDIMEVDFSNFIFESSEDVNQAYDAIEKLVADTRQQWYFLVNYKNTRIDPDAWFQFAYRGKKINISSSLGSVRFDPQEPTRDEILKRSKTEDFNPNLVSTREEALVRIAQMKETDVVE